MSIHLTEIYLKRLESNLLLRFGFVYFVDCFIHSSERSSSDFTDAAAIAPNHPSWI
ncbi:hypothetical protein Hanom_Chr09g00831841 [Helianthus anomalus]